MARIIRRRVILRSGKNRKRKLRALHLATVPQPPPAQAPNKDFYTVARPRKVHRRKRLVRHDRKRRQQLLLRLLFLQSAPSSVHVPLVKGLLLLTAESVLTNSGLLWEITYQPSLAVPFNVVLDQSPAAGVSVASGTVIQLLVSSGFAILPNEVGQPVDTATAVLIALGMLPRITVKPVVGVLPGTVIRQVPLGNSKVLVGTPVFLTVAVAPAPGADRASLPSTMDIVNVVTQVK